MAIEVFNRYEHKYLMGEDTLAEILPIIMSHMEMDCYNNGGKLYSIANIYYDTPNDELIRASLSKPAYKEKLRLRSYGIPDMESRVYLELKKKYRGIVNKRRTTLLLNEAYNFVKTGKRPDLQPYMNRQVLEEERYFISRMRLSPKVYIAYDRLAFFEVGNPDLRISFDTNIRTRRKDVSLEAGDYGIPLLDDGVWLMEIKTSLAKPCWVADMISGAGLRRTNFSKYGTEFKNYIKNKYPQVNSPVYQTEFVQEFDLVPQVLSAV